MFFIISHYVQAFSVLQRVEGNFLYHEISSRHCSRTRSGKWKRGNKTDKLKRSGDEAVHLVFTAVPTRFHPNEEKLAVQRQITGKNRRYRIPGRCVLVVWFELSRGYSKIRAVKHWINPYSLIPLTRSQVQKRGNKRKPVERGQPI